MIVRKAKKEELEQINEVYCYARKKMTETGNPNQWKDTYPSIEVIKEDIEKEQLYVCEEDDQIETVFMYSMEAEPTYTVIEEGSWPNTTPYGTMHRLASLGRKKGMASFVFNWCFCQCYNLRADTHNDNKIMQHLFEKNGFIRCGIITLKDGAKRIAYQKLQ